MSTETPEIEEQTLLEVVDDLAEFVAHTAKKHSLKADTVAGILSLWLNYDVTVKQMEMSGYQAPQGAKRLTPEEKAEILRRVAEETEAASKETTTNGE